MSSRKRRGFTLPEVLVTVAIIATLAAVLLPALTAQIAKGDSSRAAEDLLAVQTAVTAFVSDVRRYPSNLSHLTDPITTSQFDVLSSTYPSGLVAKWNGPYLSKQLEGGTIKTSFGGFIQGPMESVASVSSSFLAVRVTPISSGDFDKLDKVMDESANSSTGLFRLSMSGTVGTATFFAIPIQ